MKINLLPKKTWKQTLWKTISVVSSISLIFNMSMLGVFITPKVAEAATQYTLQGQRKDGTFTTGNICSGGGDCYAEGENVPFKLTITDLTSSTAYTAKIQHDYQDSAGRDGYVNFNTPGSWNGSASGVTLTNPVTSGGLPNTITYDINFTADSSAVELKWFGLLGQDAGEWNGAQLHVRLVEGVEQKSIGNKEVPIQVTKIIIRDLTVEKTDNPDPINLEDSTTYTITITNNGEQDETVTVTDVLPTELTYVNASGVPNPASVSGDGKTITWNNIIVESEDSTVITFDAEGVQVGTGTNNVTVQAPQLDPVYAEEDTTVLGECDLWINKTPSSEPVSPGDNLTYTITYGNSGTATCTGGGVKITDTLDPNVSFVSANPTPSGSSGSTYWWWVGNVAPQQQGQIEITVTVGETCEPIVNDYSAWADNYYGSEDNTVYGSLETDVICYGSITLIKSEANNVNPNDWNFDVDGPDDNDFADVASGPPLTNLPLGQYNATESGPSNYHFVSGSGEGCDFDQDGNLTVTLATPDQHNTCTYTNARDTGELIVRKVDELGAPLDVYVTVAGSEYNDDNWTGPDGEHNFGYIPTDTYTVTETSPNGYTPESWECTITDGQPWNGTGDTIDNAVVEKDKTTICTFTNSRDTGTITVYKNVDENGDGDLNDPEDVIGATNWTWDIANGEQNIATGSSRTLLTDTYTISEDMKADYHVTDLTCNGVGYGAVIAHDIDLTEQGVECTFTNTRDTVKVYFDKEVLGGGPGTDADWTFAIDGNGAYHDGDFAVLPTNSGPYAVTEDSQYNNLYTLTAASGVCSLVEGQIVLNTDVEGGTCVIENTRLLPTLGLTKTAPAKVNAGDNIEYTINWSVNGNSQATQVVLWDPIPTNTTFVSVDNFGVYDAATKTVTWTLGTKNPGDAGTVHMVVKTNSPLADNTIITNTSYIDSVETDPALQAVAQTEIVSGPILNITKSDTPDPVKPGDNINYTINWSISGNATAHNVKITDVIPTNTTYVSVADGGVYDVLTNTITWTLGTKNPGDSGSVHFVVKVNTPLTNGTVIKNTAIIDSDETQPTSADANTTVIAAPVLKITKSVDQTFVNPGGKANYTVVIENTGNDTAINVKLNDLLPSGFTFTDYGTNTHTFSLGNLAAGAKVSVTYNVTIGTGVAAGTYENLAVAWADNHGNVITKAPLEVRVPKVLGEEPKPELAIEKTVDKSIANPGNVIKYTVKVTNNGDATAINVQLQDVLPAGFTFDGSSDISKTWSLGDILVGETKQVTYSVKIDDKILEGKYENLAVAWADNHDQVTDFATVEVRTVKVLAETGAGTLDYLYFFGAGAVLLTSLYVLGLTRRREEK